MRSHKARPVGPVGMTSALNPPGCAFELWQLWQFFAKKGRTVCSKADFCARANGIYIRMQAMAARHEVCMRNPGYAMRGSPGLPGLGQGGAIRQNANPASVIRISYHAGPPVPQKRGFRTP